ncbi:MAG: PQQ-binding-like beta-propeller repeat protein [Nanoarchaeota archaeon]|nr:PQQ-binding-like beta-propeller repeat protein [Nanoarchaeota archaeon]MCA9496103.1 PQQ-binding-like beta-propeller repeat protein [Nanoarchaeota archaeon]
MVLIKRLFFYIFLCFLINLAFSSNPDLIWTKEINLPVTYGGFEKVDGVFSDTTGVYIVGTVMEKNAGNWYQGHKFFLQKYDPDGNLIWSKLSSNSNWAHIGGVAFDSTGIYMGAIVSNSDSWRVQKYDLNTGNIVWSRNIDHSPGVEGGNSIRDLAIDDVGVYVIGAGNPWLTNFNRIKKFDKNTGNIIWEKVMTCGLNQGSVFQNIGISSSGLFFAGNEPCYGTEYYTELRNKNTGNVIWTEPGDISNPSSNILVKGDDLYYGAVNPIIAFFVPPIVGLSVTKYNLNSKNILWSTGKNFSRTTDAVQSIIDDGSEIYAISGLGSFNEIRVLKFDTTSGDITFNYFDNRDLTTDFFLDRADITDDSLYLGGRLYISSNNYRWRIEKRNITKMVSSTFTSSNSDLDIGLKYFGPSTSSGNLEFENNGAHSTSTGNFKDFIYSKEDNSYFVLEKIPGDVTIKQGGGWKVAKYSNVNNNLIWKKEYFPPVTPGPPCFFVCSILEYSANEMYYDNLTKALYVVGGGSPSLSAQTWKIMKFNSDNGNVIWDKEYNPGTAGFLAFINMAKEIDLYNNELYIGGYVHGNGWSLQKRSTATGNLISQSPSLGIDAFHDLVVDSSGVYISGIRNTLGNGYEKWNLNLNTKLWQKNFPFNDVVIFSTHKKSNLHLDSSGLYIGASTYFPNQWNIKKLNKNDGSVIWSELYSKPTEGVIKSMGIDQTTNSLLLFGDWDVDYISRLESRDLTTGAFNWEKVINITNGYVHFNYGNAYLYDGNKIQSRYVSEDTNQINIPIAVELDHPLASPLKIYANNKTYAIILVDETDVDATNWRIQTSSGIKAIKKYTS